jgi:glycosyltransferase involved in cell wall biosynthesis
MTRTLVCLPEVPNPRISGGYGRNVAIARALTRLGCEVTILALSSQRDGGASAMLAEQGIQVVALDRDRIPVTTVLGAGFDIVFVTYYELAEQLLPYIAAAAAEASLVIDSVDLHYVRALRQGEIEGDPHAEVRAEEVRRRELAVYRQAQVVLTVSEQEQEVLSDLLPGIPVGIVPSIHAVDDDAPGPGGRRGALFVGAYNFPPNRDAARYLCREIVPQLRDLGFTDSVALVGPYLDDELSALARTAGVEPVGFVPDLSAVYAARRVFLSSVRFGSGVKTKVGEALGAGLPVVGTTMGTEGFPAGEGIVRRDDPLQLAHAVIELDDDAQWRRRSLAGRELIAAEYGPDRADRELGEVLDYVLAARGAAA